jgi:hypothetical protein
MRAFILCRSEVVTLTNGVTLYRFSCNCCTRRRTYAPMPTDQQPPYDCILNQASGMLPSV